MRKILKLIPVFQEKIWGGKRLKTVFDYEIPYEHTGECWTISAHSNGNCRIEGMEKTLAQLWEEDRALFGNLPGETFPLLVKIIDAKDDLSVQVHPGDAYAAVHENGSLGKTECWYVLDCDEGATIIIGHNAASKEELREMVAENRWTELLREFPIRKGDFFQLEPGYLHAIKSGTLILETQQSSDITYRFYDYGRLENGKTRPLHIEKSLDVTMVPFVYAPPEPIVSRVEDAQITHLITCPYYSVYRAVLHGTLHRNWTQPFVNISILDGCGTLDGMAVHKGDHLLICADYGPMELTGQMEIIWSHV